MTSLQPVNLNGPIKIAIAVRADLEVWQKLNVAAFLPSGFGTAATSLIGEIYTDGDGLTYAPMLAHPVRVFSGDQAGIKRSLERARGRGLLVSVYTDDMFTTMNDQANRATVAAVATSELRLAGIAVAGDAKQVDKAFDKLRLHG